MISVQGHSIDSDIDDLVLSLRAVKVVRGTQKQQAEMVRRGEATYVGGTKRDPEKRANEHARDKKKPGDYIMVAAPTQNMKKAEQRLLDGAIGQPGNLNKARKSGFGKSKAGNVYVMKRVGAADAA